MSTPPTEPAHSAESDARRAGWPVGGLAGEVAQFNDLVPVGSPVLYWPGARAGEGIASTTRSRAWLLGDHTPVVMVEGYGGGIALTHVCPIPPESPVSGKTGVAVPTCVTPPAAPKEATDADA